MGSLHSDATSARPVRLSFCLNAGQRKGQAQATALVAPVAELVLAAAMHKLRLKKKDMSRAHLYVWGGSGCELEDVSRLQNDDLIAVSLGEPYAGPVRTESSAGAAHSSSAAADVNATAGVAVPAPRVVGRDDTGREFASLAALWAEQAAHYGEYYAANHFWWNEDGYGGGSDEEAMIGDGGSEEDVSHSLQFLDALRAARPALQLRSALDCGAGVGRVSKHVLLRRCERVCLLEPCDRWLKQARRYLGKKRAASCLFVCERLEEHAPPEATYDLIWVQWTLQYLIDAHVVSALRRLGRALSPHGLMIVKENRQVAPMRPAANAHDTRTVIASGEEREANAVDVQGSGGGGASGGGVDGGCCHAAPNDVRCTDPVAAPAEESASNSNAHSGETEEGVFHVDTPAGPHARYDVTRPDAHHRWLFRCAGLQVEHSETCINGECTAWALRPRAVDDASERLEAPSVEQEPIPLA